MKKRLEPIPQKKLKLLHITTVPFTLYFFFHGQLGYMKQQGYQVHALSAPGELLDKLKEREEITVHSVPLNRSISPLNDVKALWKIFRLLRRLKPDIVHSHTPKAGLLGTIVARFLRVKVVALSIFGLPQMTKTGLTCRLLNLSTWLSCKLADFVWCDSPSMRDYIIKEHLCPTHKLYVFGQGSMNGIDAKGLFSPDRFGTEVRSIIRQQYGIPENAMVLGYVGRLVGDKGMHELAEAWRSIRGTHPELHCLLIGPFEDEDPLLQNDEALFRSDERIHLAGQRMDIAAHLAAMDIFVMPSYREGFGVVNIEAAAMQLPVVSTLIPGCVDSVQDGVTGVLIPTHDAKALADAIVNYCENRELRLTHGKAGRERVLRDFRQEIIWEELEQKYRQVFHQTR